MKALSEHSFVLTLVGGIAIGFGLLIANELGIAFGLKAGSA